MIIDIILVVMCSVFFGLILYVVITEEDMSKHPTHHDHLPGSFYSISHKVQRDGKKDRGF
jgi:hypothetical protein|tara:strand:+ start:448 stop:627 length:180 start_codon:yes stop_codon:yes gene_type:complete